MTITATRAGELRAGIWTARHLHAGRPVRGFSYFASPAATIAAVIRTLEKLETTP